ncbi:hypothetical protein [Tsukamurella tyrosinosolvens]|uniref:hypothetical protein n=1 Tax=Tsukamurella tyrosinosolvens TaxID=57704 RepID=UPI0007B19187|nr:hypothetical protein [Tsukamurella tyrosinosolvens]KZL97725.1 hypothetical protein AXX05_01920 [Tsukamurella tyrosinosolvens]RDB46830.1 hypothetical protein DVB87_16415 [Tsukamurella tyrosinosolvens]
MTHYWAFVVFLAVLATMAAADDVERYLRSRANTDDFNEVERGAFETRPFGARPDHTPHMRKAPVHPAKNVTEAIDQNHHRMEIQP